MRKTTNSLKTNGIKIILMLQITKLKAQKSQLHDLPKVTKDLLQMLTD